MSLKRINKSTNRLGFPIKVLNKQGATIDRFDSIDSFLKAYGIQYKLDASRLRCLNEMKLVAIGKIYICYRYANTSQIPFQLAKIEASKELERVSVIRTENINTLLKTIVSLDYEFSIVKSFQTDSLKEIASLYGISEGSVKSSLHRFKNRLTKAINGQLHMGKDTIHFAYLKDFLKA